MTDTLDYEQLDVGIRETVRMLRAWGFNTTDSGDGVSKAELIETGDALDYPHGNIVCEPMHMISQANALLFKLEEIGIGITECGGSDAWIGASYDPANEVAVITLYGVTVR